MQIAYAEFSVCSMISAVALSSAHYSWGTQSLLAERAFPIEVSAADASAPVLPNRWHGAA